MDDLIGLWLHHTRERLTQSHRWSGKFEFDENNQIHIGYLKDVEEIIDLFDERYTYSEITGAEYDTSVKILAVENQGAWYIRCQALLM